MFCPSTKPVSFKPSRNAVTRFSNGARVVLRTNPTTGIASGCALSGSGHAAAPPRCATNSRLRMSNVPAAWW